MIHIHITVKESERFPGKNTRLWHYTANWLAAELLQLHEPYSVTVTVRGQHALDTPLVPEAWDVLHLDTVPFSHESDQRAACHFAHEKHEPATPFADTLHVLLLLTQPLRRPGLMLDAIAALRASTDKAAHVVSYNDRMENGAFRKLDGDRYGISPKDHTRTKLIDGAIWAWYGDPACIFARTNAIGIQNATPWGTVDIDTAADIPHALPAIWADIMLAHSPTINH